jgi:hypothetical protein
MMSFSLKALFFGIIVLSIVLTMPSVFADSWYVGKGLKQGDYFRYNVCFIDYHSCTPLEIDFWVQNQTSDGNWNLQFVAIDGSNTKRGIVTIGSDTPDPLNYSSNLTNYVTVYKNSIIWLDLFATKNSPKDLNDLSWTSRTGLVGRTGIVLLDQEQVTVQAGSYKAWLIGWHKGVDNKIWIDPNLPFPVKAVTWVDCACGRPPPLFTFEMLEMGNSKAPPKFTSSNPFVQSQFNHANILSPRQQMASGISSENVVCSDDMVLIKKLSTNSVACVKPQTAQKLVEREWGTILLNNTQEPAIISSDASKSSQAYNTSIIKQIQKMINDCTNSKIHLNYGEGSETFSLSKGNNTCNVSITGEVEMGVFGFDCNVPLQDMAKWINWKDTDIPPSPDDIMTFCKRTH